MNIPQFSILILKLPDDRVVLQRRSRDAPHGAGLLGAFGGWLEGDELPSDCIKREIAEETSIDARNLDIRFLFDFILPANGEFNTDRKYYVFETRVKDMDFQVYEGDRAEFYRLDEIRDREDVIPSLKYVIERM